MRLIYIISFFFIIVFKFEYSINAKEIWLLDEDLSVIKFEVPVFLAKNVTGQFNHIEGFIELNEKEEIAKTLILAKIESIDINYKKYYELILSDTFLNKDEFANAIVDTIFTPISYRKEEKNKITIRLGLNGIYGWIPYNFEIIYLAPELVQVKGDFKISRTFFKIGKDKWYSTSILKEDIEINTNLFFNKR